MRMRYVEEEIKAIIDYAVNSGFQVFVSDQFRLVLIEPSESFLPNKFTCEDPFSGFEVVYEVNSGGVTAIDIKDLIMLKSIVKPSVRFGRPFYNYKNSKTWQKYVGAVVVGVGVFLVTCTCVWFLGGGAIFAGGSATGASLGATGELLTYSDKLPP